MTKVPDHRRLTSASRRQARLNAERDLDALQLRVLAILRDHEPKMAELAMASSRQ